MKIKDESKTIEDELNRVNLQINEISTFYMMISKHRKIDKLCRNDIIQFIDKIVIKEKKGSNKKRLVEVYYVLIGNM